MRDRFSDRLAELREKTPKGNVIAQPVEDVGALYRLAQTSKKTFDRTLHKIAEDVGVEAITVELKQMDRSIKKVNGKLLGQTTLLTDVVRGTVICDQVEEIGLVKEQISARFADVKFRDRFADPKPNGYRDLQAIVLIRPSRRGEKPIWAEIQVHLRSLYNAKKKGDALYNRWRVIEEAGAHHPLSPEQEAELSSLKNQEKQLYEEAFLSTH